ncbi:hypothetical protein LCGC14_2224790, partial [marine sediment metagenome]
QLNTEFLLGMGKKDDEFVLLLNIDKVFSVDELEVVRSTGETAGDNKTEEGAHADG